MSRPPDQPRIHHITSVENLTSIVRDGELMSDRRMLERGGPPVSIGMPGVKTDRLNKELECHPGDKVGDYTPFNFCPRSVMLYVIYRANHESLSYRGGQNRIVHLEADFTRVVGWADAHEVRWALTDENARAATSSSFATREELASLDWDAIRNNDFRDSFVQRAKQAEFLVHGSLPWHLVDTIGCRSVEVAAEASAAIASASHQPEVIVDASWYF